MNCCPPPLGLPPMVVAEKERQAKGSDGIGCLIRVSPRFVLVMLLDLWLRQISTF